MDDVTLPPMPEPDEITHYDYGLGDRGTTRAFSEERMQAYAREAVLAERERCAVLCESIANGMRLPAAYGASSAAAAIRNQPIEG